MATGLLVFCTTIGLMASIWILSRLRLFILLEPKGLLWLVVVLCVAAVVAGLMTLEGIKAALAS